MSKELKVEILATGNWIDMHGTEFSVDKEKLDEISDNFDSLKEVIDVNLKFGHNEDQPLTDGQPKLGHVSKLWVESAKLFAMFSDMPDIVYNAIKKKLYDNVSIEALLDVSHKGVDYGTVLTAVSLLGMDMPAVNTLADLQTYMAKGELAFSGYTTLRKTLIKPTEDHAMGMTADETAEMEQLKVELRAATIALTKAATDKVELTTKAVEDKAIIDQLKTDDKTSKFSAAKIVIEASLETLVKEKKITPAQRDKLVKECDENTIDSVQFTINTLKENSKVETKAQQGKENDSDDDDEGSTPDKTVAIKAKKFAAINKVKFTVAVKHVLDTNPKLAREYADYNDEEAA